MNKNVFSSINIIDSLYSQTSALLDLMIMADEKVDMKSVNTASEMCATMLNEIKAEVDKIYNTINAHEDDLK